MKKRNILLGLALAFCFTACYDLDKMPEGDRGGVDAGNVACIFGGSSSGDRRFFRRILLPGEHDQKHYEKNQRESKKNSGVNHFFHM